MQDLLKKLEAIQYRFAEVGTLIVDPDIISDMTRYVKLNKEYKDLEEIVFRASAQSFRKDWIIREVI